MGGVQKAREYGLEWADNHEQTATKKVFLLSSSDLSSLTIVELVARCEFFRSRKSELVGSPGAVSLQRSQLLKGVCGFVMIDTGLLVR